jgi:ADP-ribosyl-[dinitrogen reductase] hydrolase
MIDDGARRKRTIQQSGCSPHAQDCLLGQLMKDAVGSLVKFRASQASRREYPNGVHELSDGGTWNIIAGQATVNSEIALSLDRMLADQERYDPNAAFPFWRWQ